MSLLDRLQIQGVRSFGIKEEDAGLIKFKCPLTLILGHNGCGKTTIIESLKYATSGDQPPNARAGSGGGGSGFVHDPKMLKANEVLAQVKLRIKDIHGKNCTVVRIMKNIQKFKKVEFKTVEQTITTENEITGKGDAISNRCADIDKQMCYLLGVSKPILNYVIFCHQEESCWPMEEGKKVKERFDEIFDSVKYNKCLENIRKLKKQRTLGIAMLKKEAESLLVYKDEAVEKTKKLQEENMRLDSTDKTISTCNEEIAVVDGKLDTVKEKEINIANLIAEKRANDIKLEELQKAIKEIKITLRDKEFRGTDEELEKEICSFNTDLSEKKNELNKLEKEISNWVVAEKQLRLNLSKEESKLGGLKRDVKAYEELIQNRNQSINRLAADLSLQQIGSFSETQVDSMIENVMRKLREMKRDIESLKMANEKEENKLQSVIDNLREEKAKLEQIKKAKTDHLNETKIEIDKIKSEINEVAQSTKNLSMLDNKLKRINKELEEHSSSINVNDIDKEIKELQKSRDRMVDELEEINKEMDNVIEVDRIKTALDNCLDRKVSCEDEIERLRTKNEDTFRHLLDDIPQHNLSKELESCIRRLSERVQSMQRDKDGKRQELIKLESKQHHLEEKLRTANQMLSCDMEQIEKICGNEDYEELLMDVTNKLKSKQSETGKLSASDYLYREYIKKLQHPQPCCPLCRRQFEEEDNAIQLAHELEGKLKSIPSTLSILTDDQEKLSDKLNKLQQLKPVYDRVASLKHSELPMYSKELDEIKSKTAKLSDDLENIGEDLLNGPQADEQLARSLQSDAIKIDQKIFELDVLSREIEEHQSKMPMAGKTLQQVKNDRDQLQFELESTRKKIDSNQAKKVAYNERLNKLQNDKNDIIKEQLRVQTGKQQEQQLLDKEKELKELKTTLAREIESAINAAYPVQQKLDLANSNKEETRKKHSSLIDSEINKLNGLEQRCEEVHGMQNKILDFVRHGFATKLEETEIKISRVKCDLDGFEQKKLLNEAKKDTIKADLSNQDARQRDLLDNRKLREKRFEEKSLQEKIKEMNEKCGILDQNLIKEERRKLEEQFNTLMSKKNITEGRRRELAVSIGNLRTEMNKPIYKNAVKNYKDKIIDLQVEEAVNKDVDSYYIALDWALQHFHKERMAEINLIIKDLWHKIYRGHDIDHIQIKCDVESSTSADKKRTYNYRVVQVKGGNELDMRGRCSAGQKMLASIIIRMALAETFSDNCRIMTLDEPTTNLDRDNIESLSRALADIVNNQTKYKKFQLVIITHDEDFLMRLTSIDKVDKFWRVFKNEEGLSRIVSCDV